MPVLAHFESSELLKGPASPMAAQQEAHEGILRECKEVLQKHDSLINELQELKTAVEARPAIGSKPLPWNHAITGLGAFERLVVAEKRNVVAMLQLASEASFGEDPDAVETLDRKLRIRLDACNYKFHEIVWQTAKKSHDLYGLRSEYSRTPENRKKEAVIVDVVAGGGTDWIKIVTTTDRRLCYEMTDAGWDWEWEDGDEEKANEPPIAEDGETEIEVARLARQLVAAASM